MKLVGCFPFYDLKKFIKLLDPQTFARFQEHLFEFPSFSFQTRTVRRYPFHGGASVLGYLSEVTENNIEQSSGYYELGDSMGSFWICNSFYRFFGRNFLFNWF